MTNMNSLASNFPGMSHWLEKREPKTWCALDMATEGVALYGHCTSNLVEGENGCISNMRKLDLFKFLDSFIIRVKYHLQKQKQEILGFVKKGKKLTTFESKKCRYEYSAHIPVLIHTTTRTN